MEVYKVKKHETFSSIAKRFNLSAEALKKDNGWSGEVFEGARLIIREVGAVHRVKPFEKLSEIATLYELSVEELMKANYLLKPYVFAGQTLVIPKL